MAMDSTIYFVVDKAGKLVCFLKKIESAKNKLDISW